MLQQYFVCRGVRRGQMCCRKLFVVAKQKGVSQWYLLGGPDMFAVEHSPLLTVQDL